MFPRSLSPDDLAYQQEHVHDSLQANVITGTAICLCAAITSVVLRFTSRWFSRIPLGKDDFTIMAALATGTALSIMTMVLTTFGLGKHQVAQKPSQEATFGKMMIAARTLALISIFITKLSILFLYHRIFCSRKFTWVLIGVGAFTAAFSIAVALSNIFACRPFKALWDTDTNGDCLNLKALLRAVSVQDVLTDVVILCLPLPMVWQLNMSKKIKWQVTVMFLFGSLVCVGGIVRTIYATRISMKDATWENALPAMWATIEGNLAIVSACLPTYRPLIKYVFGKSADDTTTGTNSHSNVGSHYANRNLIKMNEFSDRQKSNTESREQMVDGNGINESTRKIAMNSSEIDIKNHVGKRENIRQAS